MSHNWSIYKIIIWLYLTWLTKRRHYTGKHILCQYIVHQKNGVIGYILIYLIVYVIIKSVWFLVCIYDYNYIYCLDRIDICKRQLIYNIMYFTKKSYTLYLRKSYSMTYCSFIRDDNYYKKKELRDNKRYHKWNQFFILKSIIFIVTDLSRALSAWPSLLSR